VSETPARWLFVVARDHVDLLTFMNRDAFLDPGAAVVWDRRVGERRRGVGQGSPERRRGERRRLQVAEHMARYGFAVVDLERGQVVPPPAVSARDAFRTRDG
jgi:hypothetical protein